MKSYKGYSFNFAYCEEDKIYHGTVADIEDGISFEGNNFTELEEAFKEAVDDYLAWVEELGEEPEKPNSINLRILLPRNVHTQLASEAQATGICFNAYTRERLMKAMQLVEEIEESEQSYA